VLTVRDSIRPVYTDFVEELEEKMDIKYISKEDLMIYWGRKSICIEFPDGSRRNK
jgi:hypothetical protein